MGAEAIDRQIQQAWMRGDLGKAQELATGWADRDPGEVMSWLILAETHYLHSDAAGTLRALEKAQEVDERHAMFARMVCLAALQCHAFTAAHGALYTARTLGLPKMIVADLEQRLRAHGCRSEEDGAYPEPENLDPAWRSLLPASWHVRTDKVPLVWAEYDGRLWVWNEDFAALATEFASGSPARAAWNRYPEAANRVERAFGGGILERTPEPWMLSCFQSTYLLSAAHLFGYFAYPVAQSVFTADLPDGAVTMYADSQPVVAVIENVGTAERLARLLPHAFEGRLSLRGPDETLRGALPWLLNE